MSANRNHGSAERPDTKDAREHVDAKDAREHVDARQTATRSQDTTESRREPVAAWRDERPCYESTLRVRIMSGTGNEVERLFTGHIGSAWRELQARGELLSATLLRAEAADDQYELVTQWASRDAYDRNRDSFVAEVYALAMACYIAARPTAGAYS